MSAEMKSNETATIERRSQAERRGKSERRQRTEKVEVERRQGKERREKVERRRQIDPTTCERDYTSAEIEFMTAMDKYRRENGRPFPTWSEVLEVLISIGYQKVEKPADMPPVMTGV